MALGGAAIGAIGSAANRGKLKRTGNAWYDYAQGVANTQANLTSFDTPGGKALLKLQDRQYKDNLESIENRMVAGGATMENALAARQANNESRDKVGLQLLQYDDKNRRAWQEKGLEIAGQRANFNMNNYRQAAEDWNQWGSQMAQAGLSLGSTGLLGGTASAAGAAPVNTVGVLPAEELRYGPLAPAIDTSAIGGLRKA